MKRTKYSYNQTLEERFWSRVDKTDGCWNWNACLSSKGYGQMMYQGTAFIAHRLAYELFVGPIPDGRCLDHLCRNRACVRPDHLEPVTLGENIYRGISPSALNKKKTHCSKGHPLYGPNLAIYKHYGKYAHNRRCCRTCRSEAHAAWRAQKAWPNIIQKRPSKWLNPLTIQNDPDR